MPSAVPHNSCLLAHSTASLLFSALAQETKYPHCEGPKLNTVFRLHSRQGFSIEGSHFLSPASHAISDAGQDAIGHMGTLLADVQQDVDQQSQGWLFVFFPNKFLLLFPKAIMLGILLLV